MASPVFKPTQLKKKELLRGKPVTRIKESTQKDPQDKAQNLQYKLSDKRPYIPKKFETKFSVRRKRNPMYGPGNQQMRRQRGQFLTNQNYKKYLNHYPKEKSGNEGESTLFSNFKISN